MNNQPQQIPLVQAAANHVAVFAREVLKQHNQALTVHFAVTPTGDFVCTASVGNVIQTIPGNIELGNIIQAGPGMVDPLAARNGLKLAGD